MIHLRQATSQDVPILNYWDTLPHVQESDGEDPSWDWENELGVAYPWREQLIAEVDGKSIGFIQIIDPKEEISHYWGEIGPNYRAIDIWIGEVDYLNKGYGTQMMTKAISICFEPPEVHNIIIDPLKSNTNAQRFYKRLGFEFVEERQFGYDECLVLQLTRTNWLENYADRFNNSATS
ncbi:MAG: GNAT family N-acetyltransferase [Flammeovirgaceae bacterium]|nr:GNAT family N-acetyltransferase [Flammeovirgaceae bacterium]MBE63351.1 GNAT family N-acetyltransferase [Flammeovirgaceae bacterium]